MEDFILKHLHAIENNQEFDAPSFLKQTADIIKKQKEDVSKEVWKKFLHVSKSPDFLTKLSKEERFLWADLTFELIDYTNFHLLDMFNNSVERRKEHPLFITHEGDYSYNSIARLLERIAAGFFKLNDKPYAAIFSENSLKSACVDLACMFYDIPVSPLNIHFTPENLHYIFDRLKINIVAVDNHKRLEILFDIRNRYNLDFIIIDLNSVSDKDLNYILNFDSLIKQIQNSDFEKLKNRKRIPIKDTATIMFTSGSTGVPKGVCFSVYNLVTKRYARGAALPFVGKNELLISFLPLFHTFGRYLEMLGMIYWEGTYTFAGKSDINSLIELMKKHNPTGFISVPVRWKELYEKIIEESSIQEKTAHGKLSAVKNVTGDRLRWGLSAAGYLEPKIFRFFNNMGVGLNSGFGMTEATGGISMTDPGGYVEDSVGKPLPGVYIEFSDEGELVISGHYVATYLDDESKTGKINTGDLFKQDENGNLFIIDRIKDIYKNSKGQTIAPGFIEKKFEQVPGIKQVFLAGDMKPFNALLVVPDYQDDFIKKAIKENKLEGYVSSIVSTINKELFSYERILNYKIINNEFTQEKGELTAKATYKRKVIEHNYKQEIDTLYKNDFIELPINGVSVKLNFTLLKELGVSQDEIYFKDKHLINRSNNKKLTIISIPEKKRIQIGDLEYTIDNKVIDLSLFFKHPQLWLGNKELINFLEVRYIWDFNNPEISNHIYVPKEKFMSTKNLDDLEDKNFNNYYRDLNRSIILALFSTEENALFALFKIENVMTIGEYNIVNTLSRRIEALAYHPKLKIRSTAYRILLMNQPDIDYNKYLPAFINSGKTFISKDTISEIIYDNFKGFNLQAFRTRLNAYRNGLKWPVDKKYLNQFKRILELLVSFTYRNPAAYVECRAEIITWILFDKDPNISRYAQSLFNKLAKWFDKRFELSKEELDYAYWKTKVRYQHYLTPQDEEHIEKLLYGTVYLKEAFFILFDRSEFNIKNIPPRGIYVSKISEAVNRILYRITINTVDDKHYDMVIFVNTHSKLSLVRETIYRMVKLGDNAIGGEILPKLGNFKSKKGALTLALINEFTVKDKLKTFPINLTHHDKERLRTLFIRGMSTAFRFLKIADYEIIPGRISTDNIIVREPFYKEGSIFLSLSGWEKFTSYEQILIPLYNNFYTEVVSIYPNIKHMMRLKWLFYSVLESYGVEDGIKLLEKINDEVKQNENLIFFREELENFMTMKRSKFYQNTKIWWGTYEYNVWMEQNKEADNNARFNFISNIFSLYRLDKLPLISRILFFYRTYFNNSTEELRNKFRKLFNSIDVITDQGIESRVEIKEIQESLIDEVDIAAFNLMFLPELNKSFRIDQINEEGGVIIKTEAKDNKGNSYVVREPVNPFEIGTLQKLFILDNYPMKIDNEQKHLLLMDKEEENVLGGIFYKNRFDNVVHIEGFEIHKEYRGRKLGDSLLIDFINRQSAAGKTIITAPFILIKFFNRNGFEKDPKWGALVYKTDPEV